MNCEIEFLPVGEKSKPGDAIVVRYGDANRYKLMLVDGGQAGTGKEIVQHVKSEFGPSSVISHLVLTHADKDHAAGIPDILSGLTVENLWLHLPWRAAAAALPYFSDKRWTEDDLTEAIRKEYDLIARIVAVAWEKETTAVYQPFAGDTIGPFRVLSPSKETYPLLVAQFDETPEPDREAIEAAGCWVGKPADTLDDSSGPALAERLGKGAKLTQETWGKEQLKDGETTTASNESSVVLYTECEGAGRILLTGDAGVWALGQSADFALENDLALQDFSFVQIPSHGSLRNVGPTVLNRLLGPIQTESSARRFSAYVSAPEDDKAHPHKMVLNAFIRRGGKVVMTQGGNRVYGGGFTARPGYDRNTISFAITPEVKDYD
jgi:beta-lactamase superfamily II metal-dependent hydrolase